MGAMTYAVPFLAYLMGSIPFSYLAVKGLTGEDLRRHFSGNAGATNAGRVLAQFGSPWVQKNASLLSKVVLLLDMGKGAGAVALGNHFLALGAHESLSVLAAVAALLGHAFSPFLGFKGGKGVATSIGAIAFLSSHTALATFGIWFLVWLPTRYISLSSVVAAVAVPFIYLGLSRMGVENIVNNYVLGFFVTVAVFVSWKHRANLRRILEGTEPRSGQKGTS